MPRPAKPWWRPNRGTWMVTHKGSQVNLQVTVPPPDGEAAAVEAFRRLLAGGLVAPATPAVKARVAADRYLQAARARLRPRTFTVYSQHLDHFVSAVGETAELAGLTAGQVEATAASTWASSTTHGYLGTVGVFLAASGVAVAGGKVRRPPKESRGADAVWTEEEWWTILGACRGDFRGVVRVLWHTGARPSEVMQLTAEAVDWERGVAVLKSHKTAGKGKARAIHFPPPAMVVLKRQREKHGGGFLFRQGQGCRHPEKPLDLKCGVQRMHLARERAGVPRPLVLYGLRHTYITRALEAGYSAEQVAALVGNSAAVIRANYSHVGANHDLMREIADRLSG